MATIQKTTLKRFNGTDWDPVYLANSADINYIGTGFEVASGAGFEKGEAISASATTYDILKRTVEGLTAVMKDEIPALKAGTALSSVDVSLLKGVIARNNLPTDVGGKGVEVATEEAKAALTKDDVNVGDIVKVAGGKVYLVTAVEPLTYMELTDSASEIAWARITATPTTLAGYGITDAINVSEKASTASVENAGKVMVIGADGKLTANITGDAATLGGNAPAYFATKSSVDTLSGRVTTNEGDITTLKTDIKAIDAAWITKGVISIDRLPATAVERLYVAADEAARQALTTEQVQNGDTVKVNATGKMFFVVDDTKLGTAEWEDAFMEYSAGVAGSVAWSGVTGTPTDLAGYGITDAVNTSDVVTTAAANKLLKLNADAKLDADVTGSAAKLEGHAASYFATATDMTTAQGSIKTNADAIKVLQDAVGTGSGSAGTLRDDVDTLKTDMTTAQTDITNLKAGTAITALAADKITGTLTRAQLPADISGRLFTKADLAEAKTSLTADTAAVGDIVKMANGDVYVITDATSLDADAGYTQIVSGAGNAHVTWANIDNKPTTLAEMNLTDAVTTANLVDTASVANAGKILKINAAGKLDASITGDAATVGGHAADYFATAEAHTELAGRVTTAEGNITTLQSEMKAIDAGWITTGTISIDRIPHGALERCVVVKDDAARKALTIDQVQTGDTVKVTDTGLMYFVVDDTKLAEDAGYEVYTAGTASAVDWSGVVNKPTTLVGYGITDAVAASEKVTTAAGNAGKILVLNADGKLDVDITGSVAWAKITDGPTSTVAAIDAAVEAATHANRAVLDKLSEVDGVLAYNGKKVATAEELATVALGSLQVVETAPADATAGQLVLETIK